MSDLIRPAGYPERSPNFETRHATLADFQELTLNRARNKGSLVATGKGGLKCVDHHVFKPLNGFGSVKPDDARTVRRLFVNAAQSELTSRFHLLVDSEKVRNPGNVETLKQKIEELNKFISDKFLAEERGNPHSPAISPLKREDVKNFIINIDLLKGNATADRLMNMAPEELLNLTDSANEEKAKGFENQTAAELKKIIADGELQPVEAPPTKEETAKTKQEIERVKAGISDALRFRDAIKDNFQGTAKAAQETILGKLCPNILDGLSQRANAVKKYNDIFAKHGIMLYFTEEGTLDSKDRSTLAGDFEKLLDALTLHDNDLRKELNCHCSDKEALEILEDLEKKLPRRNADASDRIQNPSTEELLMNPLKYFIPSAPLNPKKGA